MKALSIRQPWANLILQGKKTLELRSWKTTHRGPLAIHASLTVDMDACRTVGMDPQEVSTGVLLGVVEVVDVFPLDEAQYETCREQHCSSRPFQPPLFAWSLANPASLTLPALIPGRMGLFNVPDSLVAGTQAGMVQQMENEAASPDSRLPFELQVLPEPDGSSYRLALFQHGKTGTAQKQAAPRHVICELGGTALRAVADAVLETMKTNGYAATDLGIRRRVPFHLTEVSGVRLALIFLAVRPITKTARLEEISRGIRSMSDEELYYWFAKCTAPGMAERAQKALRLLVSGE